MTHEELENLIGYCAYCHEEVYAYNAYVTDNGKKYHPECHEIVSHYYYYDKFVEEFKD